MSWVKDETVCSVENCWHKVRAKGLCKIHHQRQYVKWAARQLQNPGMERARNFQRKYGLTIDQYNELLKSQDCVCKICGKNETSVDPKTSSLKRLAVDHCHDTGKIRGLLCWRCNGTIGKVKEDVELLKKMIAYLEFHNVKI